MKNGKVRAAIAMQIEIAEAVAEEMWKAFAIPGNSSSVFAPSCWCLGLISCPPSPSASAKEDKAAKGCVIFELFCLSSRRGDLGRGWFGLKMRVSFLGKWVWLS